MLRKSHILVLSILLSGLIVFSGCAKNSDDTENGQKDNTVTETAVGDTTENDTAKTPENSDVPETPEELATDTGFVNPLSGLPCSEEVFSNRPVAVMLNNIKQAMPQVGISHADIIYEVLEEGGITRLMGIFKDYAGIKEIGSIRSSRDYYIDLSDAHDAIYVHCGGSTYAKSMLAKRKTENIDGLVMANFYRSKERAKTMATEHTLMISGDGIVKNIEAKGYRNTSDAAQPLVFSKDSDLSLGQTATHIEVPFSLAFSKNPYALSTFDYDEDSKTYLKGQYEKMHIDGETGEQLSFTNVVTLECNQNVIPGDAYGCLEVKFTGEGKGFYAAEGKIKELVWKKPSRTEKYTLYEKDGVTELTLKPGKTYIAIVPTGTEVSYS